MIRTNKNFKLLLFFTIITFFSCSSDNYSISDKNGVTYITNKNIKSKAKNNKINLVNIYEIDFFKKDHSIFKTPISFDIDSNENVYILDINTSKVHKYNDRGEFLISFSNKGNGPGETQQPNGIFVKNDTILINNPVMRKQALFTTKGKYIKDIKYNSSLPAFLRKSGENYIGFYQKVIRNQEREMYYNLGLFSSKMDLIKDLSSYRVDLSKNTYFENILDMFFPFAVSNNSIIVSTNNDSKYELNIFDSNGNLKMVIEKFYRSVLLSNIEKKKMISILNSDGKITEKLNNKFKKPINFIISETNDQFWVISSIERTESNLELTKIDVFNKGVFKYSFTTDLLYCQDLYHYNLQYRIINNKLYQFSIDKGNLKVFKIIR